MATAIITEYAAVIHGVPGHASPIPLEPAIAEQVVTYTTTTPSAAFNANTRFVRIWINETADTIAHIQFGTAPTATTNDQPVVSRQEFWRGVVAGTGQKVAIVQGAA